MASEAEFADFNDSVTWVYLGMTIFCILCAGLAAGLTIGLVSIDRNELRLLQINGTAEQQAQAKRVLPLIKDHHWLLVTLFLFNAVANEALPIFLSGLVPEYVAVILATFSVLIFGEILPSSIFSGPNQLKIASNLASVVNALMIIFYVVARPIGLILDSWLGKHAENEAPFNAKDLYTLLSLSRTGAATSRSTKDVEAGVASLLENEESKMAGSLQGSESIFSEDNFEHRAPLVLLRQRSDQNLLDHDTVMIAQGAIVCSRKGVETIVQPTYHTVSGGDEVNLNWFESMGKCGFSRVLVRDGGRIVGYIVVKELLCDLSRYLNLDRANGKKEKAHHVIDLPRHHIEHFAQGTSVLDALNALQEGHSRLGVVTVDGSASGKVVGYFSMEDVLEEIIQEEIEDEKDVRKMAVQILKAGRNPSGTEAT